jgi:hypothetical protein
MFPSPLMLGKLIEARQQDVQKTVLNTRGPRTTR